MTNKSTAKPYTKCIGASATGVTQSCYLVRFKKFCILLDCGMYQEGDVATNYQVNKELLKSIHIQDIDWIVLSHLHVDHTGLIPALYAKGCQAHLYVPYGSTPFLKLLWQDSMKIMEQDCIKLNNSGKKASPFYTQADIDKAVNRIIEVKTNHVESSYLTSYALNLNPDISLTYYPANHIIHACQVYLEFQDGYVRHRLGFTGDIGGPIVQPFCAARQDLPYVDILLAESTYCDPSRRVNKLYDRQKDLEKISSVVQDSRRVLIPCFSLHRTQVMLNTLYRLWRQGDIPHDTLVLMDSPLAQKICAIWPEINGWRDIYTWQNIHWVSDWQESQNWQASNVPCVIVSASGMMTGGHSVSWCKTLLPDRRNTILFCGYSGENTLAYNIRHGDKIINVDGMEIPNNANIVELVSFSSHASYDELMEYYTALRYNKIALVHGDSKFKPAFCNKLQDKLIAQSKTSRVICANSDTKIYF